MIKLASPQKMVLNAVVIAVIATVVLFASDITVGMVLKFAADNPLLTAGGVLVGILGMLTTNEGRLMHGDAGD